MGKQVLDRITAYESRKILYPVQKIEKYCLQVKPLISQPASAQPKREGTRRPLTGWLIGTSAKVRRGLAADPGTFDLMNKGITILALSAKLVDRDQQVFEIAVDDEKGGIVDGARYCKDHRAM